LQERNSAGEGEVETLRVGLDAYAITGGDKPIPVAVTAVAVVVVLIVVRLVL
jgi:hypothetical protein